MHVVLIDHNLCKKFIECVTIMLHHNRLSALPSMRPLHIESAFMFRFLCYFIEKLDVMKLNRIWQEIITQRHSYYNTDVQSLHEFN